MSDGNVVPIDEAAAKHRARVLATQRLRRNHEAEYARLYADELRRTRGGNPEPTDGGAA